jgi:hypothetical protein
MYPKVYWIPLLPIIFFRITNNILNITRKVSIYNFLFVARQPLAGQGLTVEAARSRPDTPRTVELLWTSDQLVAEHSQQKDIRAPPGYEPAIPASERSQTHALRAPYTLS